MRLLPLTLALATLTGVATAQSFVRSFPIVTTNGIPVGLDHDLAGNLYFTDIGTNDEAGTCDINGNILSNVNVTANSGNPIGITRTPANIFITDTTGTDVDMYDLALNYVSSFSVAAETTFPEGIAWSGATGNLYVVDGTGGNRCIEYTLAGALVTIYPLNGTSIDGIAWDPTNNTFWIYDSGTDTIRHYDAAFNQIGTSPGTRAAGLSSGEGVGLIGSDLYVMATGSDAVAVFNINAVPADATAYGAGCPLPPDFYEQFAAPGTNDLSGLSITLTPTGSGYAVTPAGAFDPNFSNNLNSGDDSLFSAQPLGFTLNVPVIGPVTTVDIDSNGRCGFGLTRSDFSESVSEFLAEQLFAVCWDDLNPASGGALYFDTFPGKAMVTWDQVPQFGNSDSNTLQIQFLANNDIVMSWVQVTDDAIVGWSTGTNATDPGSMDISASLPFLTTGGAPLALSASANPVIGTSINLVTTNIPATAVVSANAFGVSSVAINFPGLPASCTWYTSGDLFTLPIASGSMTLPVPNDPNLVGLHVYAQTVTIDPTIPALLPAYLSNGLDLLFGNI